MATITLNYDASNVQAQKALDFILSLNLFQKEIKPYNNFENGISSNRRNSIKETCIDNDKNEYQQLKEAFLNYSKCSMAQKIEKYL